MTHSISGKVLLVIFIIVNLALYLASYDGATFIEGADAGQYFESGIELYRAGKIPF